jgi:predicted ATPase
MGQFGRAVGSRKRNVSLERLPLIGRDAELGMLRDALASARSGSGRLIEIVGELGTGKTRLLQALREDATGMRALNVTCEAYSAANNRTLSGGSDAGFHGYRTG